MFIACGIAYICQSKTTKRTKWYRSYSLNHRSVWAVFNWALSLWKYNQIAPTIHWTNQYMMEQSTRTHVQARLVLVLLLTQLLRGMRAPIPWHDNINCISIFKDFESAFDSVTLKYTPWIISLADFQPVSIAKSTFFIDNRGLQTDMQCQSPCE